jgi:hypothetical protein
VSAYRHLAIVNTASIHEIQRELKTLSVKELVAICGRLARYKKENKELLNYLLFEADNEAAFVENVKSEIESGFAEMNMSSLYLCKKSLRKMLRMLNRYIKFSGQEKTEVELRLFYCNALLGSGIAIEKSQTLINLYQRELKKITDKVSGMHEDLAYDYGKELGLLKIFQAG